jgi:predicted Rdx family selenoprotein
MTSVEFSIHYSAEEGYEGEALALARRLFAVYDTGIDALSLVPTEQERFALYFNGRLVASHQRDGRAPTMADVRELFSREGITIVHRPGPEEGADTDNASGCFSGGF